METPKNIWIGEFNCLRSKICVFKNGDNSKKQIKKGISKSQSRKIELEIYHEIYLQEVKKSTQFPFDDKSVM